MAIHEKLGLPFGLSVTVAFCGAWGFELIGLRSGKGFLKAIKLKRGWIALFYFVALIVYGFLGIEEAGEEWSIIMVVAVLGYFVLGASQFLEEESQEKKEDKKNSLEARTAVRLAEIEANKQVEIAKIAPQQKVAPAIAEQQIDKRAMILQLHEQGMKQNEIAERVKVSTSTVSRVINPPNRISAD
jgi:hypothetical protein